MKKQGQTFRNDPNVLKIYTKTGLAIVNINEPQAYHFTSRKYSPLFRAVESWFESWINEPQRHEERAMYFGSFEELGGESYLSHREAIAEGVRAVIEYMEETGKRTIDTREFYKIDLAGIFQA